MIYIRTYEHTEEPQSHLINPKYIVSIDELSNGTSEITMESGTRYIVDATIWDLMTLIKRYEEKINE